MKTINDGVWSSRDDKLQTREQDRMIVREMTAMVRHIMSMAADGQRMQWIGSKTDLLEMLKAVAEKGDLCLRDGSMADFAHLIRIVFGVFGMQEVRNPYHVVQRALGRKGVRCRSLKERMRHVLFSDERYDMDAFWKTLIIKAV